MSRSDPQKKVIARTQGSDGSTSMHSAHSLGERLEETDEDYVSFPSLPDPEQEHSMMLKSILSKTLRKVTGNAAHLMKNSARSISLDDTYNRQHLVEESPVRYPTLTTRVCSGGESIAHEMYPTRKHNEAEEEYSMSLRDAGSGSDAPKGRSEFESHTKDTSQDNSSIMEDKLDNDSSSAVKDLQSIVPPDVAKVSTDGKGIWLSSTRTSTPVPPLPVSKVSLSSLASVNAIASTDKSTFPPQSEQAVMDNKAVVSLDHNNNQGGIKSEAKSLQTRISSIFNNLPNDIELSDDSEGDSENEIDDADHANLTIENEGGGSQINRKDFGSNRKDDTIPDYSGEAEYKKRTESLKKNPRQVSNLSQALLDNAKSLINVGSTSYPSSIKSASNSKERKKRYSENPLKNGGISKRYWMNDSFVSDCTNCFKPFTAFRRKHHCRFCGQIFCSECTLFISYNRHKQERKSHTKSVRFNDNDKLRVCKPCYSDVIVYLSDDSTETSSFSGNEDSINPANDVHSSSVTLARTRTHSFNSCSECLNEGLISKNTNLTSPSANSQRPEDSFHSPTGINTPKGNVNIMKIRNNSKRAPKMAIPATRKGEAVEIPASKSLANNINSSPHSSLLGSNVDINGKSWFKTYAALKNNSSLLPVKASASADSTFKPLLRSSSSKYRLNGKSGSSYYARNGDNLHGLGDNSENENEYEGDQDEPESETEDEQVMSLYASLNHKDHSGNEVNKSLSPRNQTSLTISGSVPTLGEFPAMKVGNTNFPKTYSYETYHVPFQKDGLNSVKDNDSYNFPHVSFMEDSSRGHNLRSHERAHASLMRMRTRRRSKPVRKLSIMTQNNNRLLGLDSTVSSSFRGEHSPTESPTSQCSNRSASVLPQTLAASSNDVFSSSSFVHPSSSSPGLLTLGNSLSKDDILEKVPSRGDYVATDTEYEVTSPSKDFAIGYFDSGLQSVKKEHFRIYTDHLNKIMDQSLRDGEINENVERWKCTLNRVLSYINKLKINDTLDIRQYIKVKRILGGQIEECDIIDGLFITKNVDSRQMCTRISNPKIALLMFPLEYLKQKEQFISLRIVYSQESVYIKNLVSRIVALKPDIIVVGDTVSGLAEKLLEEEKITVISNTKPQVIERISRYTKANIFQSINDLFFKNGSLGSCKLFEVKKFSFQNEVKSFVFFTGNDIESGFTICLRGGGEDVLNSIKFTTETLIPGVLNKRFEMGLLENQGLKIASSYEPTDEAYNILRELEQCNKEKNKLSETISCLKEVIIENMELTSYVQNFRERVLSDSPIVKVSLPLALRNVILSFKGIVEEAKVYDEISQVKSVEEINPQWLERLRLSLDFEAFPNKFKDILEVLKITSKNSIFASIDNFQERSRTWTNSTKFPSYQLYPIFHRSIHFLHSTVSMKHATPCSGPNTIVINYYTDNDKCLGLFLDQLFQDAPKLCDECGDPYSKHYNTYVHGRGKMDIIIEEYSGIVCDQDNSTRNQRFMWSSCKKCNTTTPIAPLSDETYYLSIGKFFEIGFYGSDVTVWGTACDHDFFEFHVRYFTFNNMVIKMEYSNIDTYEVVVPKKQLEYTPNKDIELKVKTFNQVNLRTDKLFQSVLSRLNRINSQNFDNPTEIEQKLEEFKNRLFFERDSLKKKTLDIYNSTEPTVHLSLNSVLRELQELGVLWDHDFNEFGRRFFPSENELTRMTQSHVKKFLLDKYNSENSAAEDITPSKAIEAESLSEPFDDKSLNDDIPNNEEAADISGVANSTNPQSPLKVEKRNSDSKKPVSSSVLEKVNKMEALMENDGNQSRKNDKDNASNDSNIFNNNSRRSSSNSVPQNKVTQLASFFNQMNLDQISLEFKKEREREFQKKVNKFKAMPVVASKPIVEIYNKIEDVVDVNDDNENDKDEHRSKSKLSLHNEQKPSIHDAERSIIEKTAQAKKESRTNDKEGSSLRDKQIDLPQPERNSLLKSLTNFWADRSTGLWEPLEYPLSSTEHTFADSDVIVREDEPSSLIAFCLSSSDYVQKLKSMASDTTDDDIDMSDPSNKKHKVFSKIEKKFKNNSGIESLNECERVMSKNRSNHLKYQFNDGETNLSCKIFYSEQFGAFRKACGNDKNFIQSLSRCVKWDSSGGKSGSNFLKTLDDRYIVKELSKSELESFVSMAPFYFKYIAQSIFHTLTTAIAKIFGFYQIQIKNNDTGKSVKMDLLIMENLFCNHKTTRIFDLKGSMRNRHVKQTGKENEVLLDENMIEYIYESPVFVKEHSKKLLRASLFNDTSFLSAMDVMDYSLIIGIDDSSGRLYVGIIDWLQTFTWDKKVENWVKGSNLIGGGKRGKDPTIITPKQYRIRFREAMERYILQVPDYWYEGK